MSMDKKIRQKGILIPALAIMLVLTGCSSELQDSMIEQLNSNQSIVINITNPEDNTQGNDVYVEWTELAHLTNYANFRLAVEDTMGIVPFGKNGKNGLIFVDAVGKQTNNSVLKYAFMNKKFVNEWNGEVLPRTFKEEAKKLYVDVESNSIALVAGINAYYNLIDDGENGYANLYSTLNRLEAMSAMVKATTPVQEINAENFNSTVGVNSEIASLASLVDNKVYISTKNKSLDNNTATGTMTRAEFIYLLVNVMYPDEYNALMSQEKIDNVGFTDAKCVDNLAEKIGFIPEGGTAPERIESYLLSYSLQAGDNELPKELYGALVVAYNRGLISSDTRWGDGIIKGEALNFMINAFAQQDTEFSVDRGESTGEAVGSLEDFKNKTTEDECKQLWDPDIHCTYEKIEANEEDGVAESETLIVDDEMIDALNKYSEPYFKVDKEQIKEKSTMVLRLYYNNAINKDQWYDFLFGKIDLTSEIEEFYKVEEQTEQTESTETDNEDLLNQWLTDQNKEDEEE